jgi:hypothetical protein
MPPESEEVLISEMEVLDGERTLYVYAAPDDFIITIPAGAKVTFGYFNPASAGQPNVRYDYERPAGQTMRTTALRVYEKAEKGNQLACFMGVTGFRDVDLVKKTVKHRKVTIETNFEDDGRQQNYQRRQEVQELTRPEQDEQIPF